MHRASTKRGSLFAVTDAGGGLCFDPPTAIHSNTMLGGYAPNKGKHDRYDFGVVSSRSIVSCGTAICSNPRRSLDLVTSRTQAVFRCTS